MVVKIESWVVGTKRDGSSVVRHSGSGVHDTSGAADSGGRLIAIWSRGRKGVGNAGEQREHSCQ